MSIKNYLLEGATDFRENVEKSLADNKVIKSNDVQLENLRINSINFNRNSLRDVFIKKFIVETAFNSLPIDEPEKNANEDEIKANMEETLDEFFNVSKLLESKNRTNFQQRMILIAENFADEKVKDAIDKGLEPAIAKEFNDEDKVRVLHSVKSANGETKIVDKVQDNVIKAVANEEKIAEEKKEAESKIDEKIDSKLGKTNEETKMETNQEINESTLLKAITIGKGKEVLREGSDPRTILAEALISYTLLETLNTMKLIEVTPYSLSKIKNKFILGK